MARRPRSQIKAEVENTKALIDLHAEVRKSFETSAVYSEQTKGSLLRENDAVISQYRKNLALLLSELKGARD